MKNLKKNLLGPVQIVVLAVIISAAASYVYAGSFVEPSCSPPSSTCNAEAPLNISSASQIKVGRLTVASAPVTTGLEVVNGDVQVDGQANGGNVIAKAFFYSSDKNLKQNIVPLNNSLNKILQLQGVSFNWKKGGAAGVGLVAQDVEKVYPELVSTDASTGLKSVQYGSLIAPLIEAIKAQQKEIDQLKAEIQAMKK